MSLYHTTVSIYLICSLGQSQQRMFPCWSKVVSKKVNTETAFVGFRAFMIAVFN
jgi:hypothetical protein